MMKNTLITVAEQMTRNYQEAMMDFLNDTQGDQYVKDFADDLITLGRTLQALSSRDPRVALPAFRGELAAGNTMMMLSNEEFHKVEAWSFAKEDFQIVIFREDGSPVGVIKSSEANW